MLRSDVLEVRDGALLFKFNPARLVFGRGVLSGIPQRVNMKVRSHVNSAIGDNRRGIDRLPQVGFTQHFQTEYRWARPS